MRAALANAPMVIVCEAVCLRDDHRQAAGLTMAEVEQSDTGVVDILPKRSALTLYPA